MLEDPSPEISPFINYDEDYSFQFLPTEFRSDPAIVNSQRIADEQARRPSGNNKTHLPPVMSNLIAADPKTVMQQKKLDELARQKMEIERQIEAMEKSVAKAGSMRMRITFGSLVFSLEKTSN